MVFSARNFNVLRFSSKKEVSRMNLMKPILAEETQVHLLSSFFFLCISLNKNVRRGLLEEKSKVEEKELERADEG